MADDQVRGALMASTRDMQMLKRPWHKGKQYKGRQSITRPEMGSKRTLYGTSVPLSMRGGGATVRVTYDKHEVADIRRRLSLAQTPRTAPRSRTAFAKTMYASCKEQFIEEDINRTDRYRKLTSSVHKPRTSYKGPLRGSPGSWRRSGKRPGTATRSDDSVFALTRPSTAGTAPMGLSSPLRSPHRGNAGYGDRPGTSGPASDPMARARQGAVSPYAQTVSKDTRDRILYAKFVVNGNKGRPVDQDAALNYFEGQLEHAADHGFKLSGRLCQRWRRAVPGVINTKYLVNKVAEIARAPTGQPEIKRAAAVLCLWLRLHAKRVRSEFVETHTRVFGEIEEWFDVAWTAASGLPATRTARPQSATATRSPSLSTPKATGGFWGSRATVASTSTARRTSRPASAAPARSRLAPATSRVTEDGGGTAAIVRYLEKRGPPKVVDGPTLHMPRWVHLVSRTLETPVVDRLIDQFMSVHQQNVVARMVSDAPPM